MSETSEYAGACPVCGGLVFMETWYDMDDEVEVEYICRSCRKVFSSI